MRKAPAGISTNDLVFSAYVGANDRLFPFVLSLYVPDGATIADTTYGRGVFWRQVEEGRYKVLATDLMTGVDATKLPYDDGSIDCVVFDPPYMHTPGGTAHDGHQGYELCYKNNVASTVESEEPRNHNTVLQLYFKAGREALRVLRPDNGIYIVKCQDEVWASIQKLTHVEIINHFEQELGFVCEDLFVLVARGHPGVSRMLRQRHARRNHSYFLVFRKRLGAARWMGIPGPPMQPDMTADDFAALVGEG